MLDSGGGSTYFGGAVLALRFPSLVDERGALVPIDFTRIAFSPVRAFVVEAPPGAQRGGHAHKSGKQLLLRVGGAIRVDTAWLREERSFVLDAVDNGLLIASPVWSRQTYCTEGAKLLVFCDTPYDPSSYVNERDA